MMRRAVLATALATAATVALTSTALAHPLGNFTVNRAVAVTLTPGAVLVRYIVDMAEIPAFATIQAIDSDADGTIVSNEGRRWADATCNLASTAVELVVDNQVWPLAVDGSPQLAFPAGAGGLETLRLECSLRAALMPAEGEHRLSVRDRTDDGHVGWREVTIVPDGVRLLTSDVPVVSPSAGLTAYPIDALETPPDVRSATAIFHAGGSAAVPGGAATADNGPRSTSVDPLASLIAGEPTLPVALLALLIAAALGAAHALTPGHGKGLVAAYLIGSRGTLRQAAGLGATVAATHTLGVFALGGMTLVAGELFVPETAIAWLSVMSGGLVAVLGLVLVWRALRPQRRLQHHDHAHGDEAHGHHHPPRLSTPGLVALGLAGGMVPSASALIVLLAAVSTGRLAFGLGLIVAFGFGMALVLGGLAGLTAFAAGRVVGQGGLASRPLLRRAASLLPIASGATVLVIGCVFTVTALSRIV
jgi:nickel/cobalt exporter